MRTVKLVGRRRMMRQKSMEKGGGGDMEIGRGGLWEARDSGHGDSYC